MICCLSSGAATFFFWGFGTNNTLLILYAFTFGLFAPSVTTLWSRMISVIVCTCRSKVKASLLTSADDLVLIPIIFSTLSFVRGVGNFVSGPISNELLKISALDGAVGAYGYDDYVSLIIRSYADFRALFCFGLALHAWLGRVRSFFSAVISNAVAIPIPVFDTSILVCDPPALPLGLTALRLTYTAVLDFHRNVYYDICVYICGLSHETPLLTVQRVIESSPSPFRTKL